MITLQNISAGYGGTLVLENLNLVLADGERAVLYGASGRGKTTLLHLLAGLLEPTSGQVLGLPEEGVSVLFQEDRLLPGLTVAENLRLVNRNLGDSELVELLSASGLEGEGGSYPGELSGGMRRRVALLRALVFDRPLVLMDEPFTGLDGETRRQMAQLILRRCEGKTLLVTSHQQEDTELLCARALRLEELDERK